MTQKITLNLLGFLFCFSLQGQVDSLDKVYKTQKGKDKILTLNDLCYYTALSDNGASKKYGKLAELEAKKIGDSSLLASVWNDWSIAYFYNGDLDSSLLLNQQALKYRIQLKDTVGIAKSWSKIAGTYYEKGLLDKSLHANIEALKFFKVMHLEQMYCQIYTNIGNVYDRINKPEKALEYHSKAIKEATKFQNYPAVVIAKINKANSLRTLNRSLEARKEYTEVIPLIQELNMVEQYAGVYQGLGVIERESGNIDLAIKNYELALKYYRDVDANSGITLVLANLGNCYLDKKQYDKAEGYLKESLDIALEMNSHYTIRHAYKGLTRLENLKGDFKKADMYFDLYVSQMDSIYNATSSAALAEMHVKFETEERELELAESKLKNKNTTILLLISGVCVLVLLVFIWMISQRRKLDRKNSEIAILQNLEKERGRIARDLHDNLGAELTMITSKLDMKSFKAEGEIEKSELEEIGSISRNANHMLRETIWSIHQDRISLRELHAKSKAYVERVFGGHSVAITALVEDSDAVISPANALHIFRIIQESVNNAFKYSNCTELTINISKNKIEVTDNGNGFDVDHVQKGYGLQNMQQRVIEMNAELNITSSLIGGTKVEINF